MLVLKIIDQFAIQYDRNFHVSFVCSHWGEKSIFLQQNLFTWNFALKQSFRWQNMKKRERKGKSWERLFLSLSHSWSVILTAWLLYACSVIMNFGTFRSLDSWNLLHCFSVWFSCYSWNIVLGLQKEPVFASSLFC